MNVKLPNTKSTVAPGLAMVSLVIFSLLLFVTIHETHSRYYSIYGRTWGFDNFQFYEVLTQYGLLFVAIVLLIPYTNRLLRLPVYNFAAFVQKAAKKKLLVFSILSVVSVFIFHFLQVKYHFLGDFNLRMIQTMKKEWVNTEIATMRLLYLFASAGKKAGADPEQMFRLYSCIAGGIYIFFSFLIADVLGKNIFRKLFIFLAQISTALVLMFCGYVEIYATPALLLHIYTYTGICYLRGKQRIVWPVIALIAAIFSHLLCVAALPSLPVLYYFKETEKFTVIRTKKNVLIGLALTAGVLLAIIAALYIEHPFILPWKHNTYMTFLSRPHLWEIFNGQFLACGLFFIFLFVLSLKSITKGIRWSGDEYFLLAITGGLFFLVFMSNLQRGSGDWDLMSFPAVTLNILVMLLIFRVYNTNEASVFYLALMVTGITALNSFLWVHINSTDRSIAKIKSMLMTDPGTYYTARISGEVQLALIFKNNKLLKEAEEMSLYTCRQAAKDEVRACVMYAMRLQETGRIEETRVFFEDMLENRTPYVIEAYLFLLKYYLKYYQDTKNQERIHFYLDKFYEAFKQNPSPFINNVNFRKSSMVTIFELYYQFEEPKKNEEKLKEIRSMIQAISELKRPNEK